MRKWLRRIGGAFGVGLAWALAWAPVAVVIGIGIIDPDESMDEMWFVIGAYPGFLCGVIFSAVLAIVERGRRLDELPFSRIALLGAASGLSVGLVPFALGEPTTTVPLWQLVGGFAGAVVLLSTLSAMASALVLRTLRRRRLQRA
jgi:hypothetical protein